MLNFPDAPTLGQVFGVYTWDGVKWTGKMQATEAGSYASDLDPLMNGVMLPGLATVYARADHVHPTDTSRVKPNDAALTGTTWGADVDIDGDVTVAGLISGLYAEHRLGSASGDAMAPDKADANILLYDRGVNDWAGIGTDVDGRFFIRTATTGFPASALVINKDRAANFLKVPIAPTPSAGDSSTKFATTAFVQANPATGPYMLLAGGTMTGRLDVNGYIRNWRGGGETGVIYLSNPGRNDRYLYYDGANFSLNGQSLNTANGRIWGSSDFSTPIVNIRFAYLGDVQHGSGGLSEPYGGGVETGRSGAYMANWVVRYRQFQVQFTSGWAAVGYA